MTQTRIRIIDANSPRVPRDHDRFNVNGPSVLPAPGWMPDPPGRYLMFFAHHTGQSIRLAAADDPTGPWRIVEPDVLPVDDTPSDRQPRNGLRDPGRGRDAVQGNRPSDRQPQNGLRDPFVLDTGGRRWLFYAAAGECALGLTDISSV